MASGWHTWTAQIGTVFITAESSTGQCWSRISQSPCNNLPATHTATNKIHSYIFPFGGRCKIQWMEISLRYQWSKKLSSTLYPKLKPKLQAGERSLHGDPAEGLRTDHRKGCWPQRPPPEDYFLPATPLLPALVWSHCFPVYKTYWKIFICKCSASQVPMPRAHWVLATERRVRGRSRESLWQVRVESMGQPPWIHKSTWDSFKKECLFLSGPPARGSPFARQKQGPSSCPQYQATVHVFPKVYIPRKDLASSVWPYVQNPAVLDGCQAAGGKKQSTGHLADTQMNTGRWGNRAGTASTTCGLQ